MAIEAVLFDYSGVMTTGLHLPTQNVPYDPDALLTEMISVLASPDANPWHELERGEISLQSFLDHVDSLVPGGSAVFAVDSDLNVMGNLTLLDHRVALVEELKATGVRVGLVTNNVTEWKSLWRPRLPPGLFEIVVDSAEVGHRKPEAEIYQIAMNRMGIADPTTVLFIDDFEWNVTGATNVGMGGLHYTHGTDLRSEVLAIINV